MTDLARIRLPARPAERRRRLYLVQVNNHYGKNIFFPYSVGLLWAYARTFPDVAEAYELGGILYRKELIADVVARLDAPDVVAISGYIWNWQWSLALARAVKARWPECVVVVGGAHVPPEASFLEQNPCFDYAIYGEGEGAFVAFLRMVADPRVHPEDASSMIGSLIWRDHDREAYVNVRAPFVDLAELRSPYLDGVFDPIWEPGWKWQALQETHRGCPYASFGGDTLVALPDRILRFDEERYGDDTTLPCPDPAHCHRLGTDDDRLVSQGVRECVRIGFSNGLYLTVTPNHPMLVVRSEEIVDVAAAGLFVGDWVPVEVGQNAVEELVVLSPPAATTEEVRAAQGIGQGHRVPAAATMPSHLDERVAWLAGYLVGDGCLPTDNRASVLFAVKDRSRVMLKTLVSDLFDVELKIYPSKFTTKMQNGTVDSRKVVQFFRESLGMKSGEEKLRVPRGIFRSPAPVARAFLDGLWCADGHQPPHGESYLTTVSEQLANECAALIHWIGDAAVVRKVTLSINRTGSLANAKPYVYRVEWHGQECWSRRKGKPCVASRVPAVRHTYRDHDTGALRLRATPQARHRDGSPREVLRYFEPDHPLLDARFVYVRVVSVQSVSARETYDVHHHPEHKVAANGVYVRQCTFCEWGEASLNKVRPIADGRVLAEYEWFADHGVELLYNCDANYGILKRDLAITEALVETKRRKGAPVQFRAAFAKNSNEKIFQIATALHEAGMLKAVTLAMQSMDDGVLEIIKRTNIKVDNFGPLIERYAAAGMPTYTELILGLPGETLGSYLAGIDTLLDAGQHDGLTIYPCVLLPNTEMNTPGSIAGYGIESREMQAMLLHATPEPGVIIETQQVVVGTKAMPHWQWKIAFLRSWVVQVFHVLGLTQLAAIETRREGAWRYQAFYELLHRWLDCNPHTVAGGELAEVEALLDQALVGGSWNCVDPRFGDISWPPEEFAFLRIACQLDRFYDELEDFGRSAALKPGLIARQRAELAGPAPGHEEEWAREVVWYGRKGYGARKRKAS